MIIIGITGTLGAGKGTAVDYLVKNKNFKHFSVREYLIKEIKKDGNIVNRDSMTNKANELRAEFGPSYIVDELYKLATDASSNCIIESIRTSGEIESLRKKAEFYLFAIDADVKTRYERIVKRASSTDKISYAEFLANETREMTSADPNKQNLKKCIEISDFKIMNNGTIKELNEKVDKIIQKLLPS
ncbi:MAG TPA: AAA family ATPase [Patescibacteria group bacterium]|nr:AAA family ATPase [Patescibacteria group bacterium]